jgi:hypothetical protein
MACEPKHENLVSIIEKGHLKVQSDKNFREVLIDIKRCSCLATKPLSVLNSYNN